MPDRAANRWGWLNATVLAIALATFFSDVSHELVTPLLPLYLGSVGLAATALGVIEGVGDFLLSVSKLAGGVVGQRVRSKRLWCSVGYLVTAVGTALMGLVQGLWALLTLRCLAWLGRGFRSPLRDALMAENVEPRYYGRAYGLERTADMLGAVGGQVLAIALVWSAFSIGNVIVWAIVPGLLAAASMFFLARDRAEEVPKDAPRPPRSPFRPAFYWFLGGVFLFGLGDFSRTFLVLLTAYAWGDPNPDRTTLTLFVGVYLVHNLVSALAAYAVGSLADRWAKRPVLLLGYGLGVLTNGLLAFWFAWLPGLLVVVVLSGVYIAVEETVEKATAAELLRPDHRSLGFGLLACVNAVGDMVSSVAVGVLLDAGLGSPAFTIAAGCGLLGVAWLVVFRARMRPEPSTPAG